MTDTSFFEPRNELAFTEDGKTHVGRWSVTDGLVTVWLGLHEPHRAHLGGMRAEVLARLLFGELMDRETQAETR